MRKITLLSMLLTLAIGFSGCFKKEVSDEVANKLPVCIETSENMYTMSQGSIAEVTGYFQQIAGEEVFAMLPIKDGKQLFFKIRDEKIYLNTRYQELEKGACMEIVYVKVTDENDKISFEADASKPQDYRNLVRVAEYIFKF